jgi:hypothetical protein
VEWALYGGGDLAILKALIMAKADIRRKKEVRHDQLSN